MSKQYEEIRRKIAKQYNEKINELERENKSLRESNVSLKKENERLEEDLSKKEEIITQLETYLDLSKEDLLVLIEREKVHKNMESVFSDMSRIMRNF